MAMRIARRILESRKMRLKVSEEQGDVLVWTVFLIILLMVFSGISFDVGMAYAKKAQMESVVQVVRDSCLESTVLYRNSEYPNYDYAKNATENLRRNGYEGRIYVCYYELSPNELTGNGYTTTDHADKSDDTLLNYKFVKYTAEQRRAWAVEITLVDRYKSVFAKMIAGIPDNWKITVHALTGTTNKSATQVYRPSWTTAMKDGYLIGLASAEAPTDNLAAKKMWNAELGGSASETIETLPESQIGYEPHSGSSSETATNKFYETNNSIFYIPEGYDWSVWELAFVESETTKKHVIEADSPLIYPSKNNVFAIMSYIGKNANTQVSSAEERIKGIETASNIVLYAALPWDCIGSITNSETGKNENEPHYTSSKTIMTRMFDWTHDGHSPIARTVRNSDKTTSYSTSDWFSMLGEYVQSYADNQMAGYRVNGKV